VRTWTKQYFHWPQAFNFLRSVGNFNEIFLHDVASISSTNDFDSKAQFCFMQAIVFSICKWSVNKQMTLANVRDFPDW
jgi:hypothetical protein